MSASFDGASHQKGYEEGRAEAFEEVIGIVRENLKTVGEFSEDCFITSKVKAFAIIALRDVLAALASLTKKKYE